MKSAEFDDNSFGLSLYPVNSRDAMPIYRPNYVTIIIQTLSILLCFFFIISGVLCRILNVLIRPDILAIMT